jgi:hypothetical protein
VGAFCGLVAGRFEFRLRVEPSVAHESHARKFDISLEGPRRVTSDSPPIISADEPDLYRQFKRIRLDRLGADDLNVALVNILNKG